MSGAGCVRVSWFIRSGHPSVIKAIAYLRVSTAEQAEQGVSLAAQREKVELYAALHGLELVAVESDIGASAKTLDRPALRRALDALESGSASALLIVKLDRLTRSVRDLGALVERYFAGEQYTLMSVADNIDTSSAAGRLVLNVLVSVSQWEREAIGERTSVALQHLLRKGVKMGRAPFGWRFGEEIDSDGRRGLVLVEDEQATIERITGMVDVGDTYESIASALNADGVTTQRGAGWTRQAVGRVVKQVRERDAELTDEE